MAQLFVSRSISMLLLEVPEEKENDMSHINSHGEYCKKSHVCMKLF